MERWYFLITVKFYFWTFQRLKIRSFVSQKVDGNMIFTNYWKVLLLNFSKMGNTVFFWAKKLMERWYLLGLFELSMIFQYLGNMVFRAVSSTSCEASEALAFAQSLGIAYTYQDALSCSNFVKKTLINSGFVLKPSYQSLWFLVNVLFG